MSEYMKVMKDMRVVESRSLGGLYGLLRLTPADGSAMPPTVPGQFVQVEVPDSKVTFLRRPISVNMVDTDSNELWLLVRKAGAGTRRLTEAAAGESLSVIMPLGHGFSLPQGPGVLLVGGGVGVAPLLYMARALCERGSRPDIVLGARTAADVLLLDEFERYGRVHVSTEDGSMGERGLVTTNSAMDGEVRHIACCGPTPMMRAVAAIARRRGVCCEVSLENVMACGLGACLCCVEDTTEGNVCVCTEGPVFNIDRLKWQI